MKVRDNIPDDDLLVKVSFRLRIGELIDSNLMQLLPLNFSKKIVKSLMGESDEELAPATAPVEQPTPPPVATSQPQPAPQAPPMQQPASNQMQQPMYQQPMYAQQPATPVYQQPMYQMPQQPTQQPVNVQQAQFASFEAANITQAEARNLNMLLRYSVTSYSRTRSYKTFCKRNFRTIKWFYY